MLGQILLASYSFFSIEAGHFLVLKKYELLVFFFTSR